MTRWIALLALCIALTVHAGSRAGEPPRGPASVVDATMAACTDESGSMTSPGDDTGRELVEARRTWRAVAIELLRSVGPEPWSSQAAFVTGMRMVEARQSFDRAIERALSRPRGDGDVAKLLAAARQFTERGASPIHALRADDPALVDAAVSACLVGLPEALVPFAADDGGRDGPDADLWPDLGPGRGSAAAAEVLITALAQPQFEGPWLARARTGAAGLRDAASVAAFRPEVNALAESALATISLMRSLATVTWLDGAVQAKLQARCTEALAGLDRAHDRRASLAELEALRDLGRLIEDLGVICAGRGGRPPMGVDGAARCVGLVLAVDHGAERIKAASVLATMMRVQAEALPGSMPTIMGSILRRSSKDRTALIAWMADGAGQPVPTDALAAAERAAEDIALLARTAKTTARAAALGTRAQKAAMRTAERAADGLQADRTREAATATLVALDRRLGSWIAFPGESGLRAEASAVASVAGPAAARLAARIDRTRTQWAASLARPEQAEVAAMELLQRLMTMVDRTAALGLDDAAVMATSATVARWAAWCPGADGVAVTLAPLRPRLSLACLAAAEGQWGECERLLGEIELELPISEFVATVAVKMAPSLPAVAPTITATIRSIMAPVHEGSWLAEDRARLATLARAWRELRHAKTAGNEPGAQASAAVATQVARDLLDSLDATLPDTVSP